LAKVVISIEDKKNGEVSVTLRHEPPIGISKLMEIVASGEMTNAQFVGLSVFEHILDLIKQYGDDEDEEGIHIKK